MDARGRHAQGAAGEISLTGAEFALLEMLASSPGAIRSKDELSRHALGRDALPFDRSVDTHISRLRHKLEQAKAGVELRNVRGRGYCLTARENTQ